MARFDELRYYRFGLRLGLENLLRNGFRLGLEKTAGKILQPINSYTRFPEYGFVGQQIERHLLASSLIGRARILDVASPKCFGLYLAFHFDVEIHLTDVDEPTVREAQVLWAAIRDRARGKAVFSVADARSLRYAEEFDAVYSMSVIEHVEGRSGDSDALKELVRVLKPGGMLVVTVAFGREYVEQERVGLQGAARKTGDQHRYFFQRIYTPRAARERILGAVRGANLIQAVTVSRKDPAAARLYRRVSSGLQGICGWLNPLLSAALNRSEQGIVPVVSSHYGDLHRASDLYGDLMLAWRKNRLKTKAA